MSSIENATQSVGGVRFRLWKVAAVLIIGLIVVAAAGAVLMRAQEISRQKQTQETLEAGTRAYSKGNFDKAIISLKKTVEADPHSPKAHLLLARSYEAAGKLKEAETSYKASLDADPKQPEALYNLAIIYKSQGKTKEAIKELEKAVKLDKYFVAARLILAELFTQQNQKQKAIEQYEEVIEMKPFGLDLTELEKKLDSLK